jgi:hypothetical protein
MNQQLREQDFKSKVFSALGVFDIEDGAKTHDGKKFWLEVKKAAQAYADSQVEENMQELADFFMKRDGATYVVEEILKRKAALQERGHNDT